MKRSIHRISTRQLSITAVVTVGAGSFCSGSSPGVGTHGSCPKAEPVKPAGKRYYRETTGSLLKPRVARHIKKWCSK